MYNVYIPLLTYRHASGRAGSEVIPGLAKSLPTVTNGGRTYTLFLREGLRYSDGTPVEPSDFEFSVKRMFQLNSAGSYLYTGIAGARGFQRTGRGGIGGIVTDGRTGKIVIHLAEPSGAFANLLALPFAAPVPPDTPMREQSLQPPPATGPYAFVNSNPAEGWAYERNPIWEAGNGPLLSQLPDGEVERIEVRAGLGAAAAVKAVATGKADWVQSPLPITRFAKPLRRSGNAQLRLDPILNAQFFWMNTTRPPFDDLRVRRAANYAVSPKALSRIYEGEIVPTHQILPPGMPGFERFDLYRHSLAKARRLVARADPADREITVRTISEPPHARAGSYFASRLRKLGFRVHLRVLDPFAYFSAIGNASTPNLDAGWANWYVDLAHPEDFFRPLMLSSSIRRTSNTNLARLDVPKLDEEVEELSGNPLGPATERAYARLDRGYMKQAPWVPYGTNVYSTLVSKDVNLDEVIWNPMFGADLTSFETE